MQYRITHRKTKRQHTFNCKTHEEFFVKVSRTLGKPAIEYDVMLIGNATGGKLVKGGAHGSMSSVSPR